MAQRRPEHTSPVDGDTEHGEALTPAGDDDHGRRGNGGAGVDAAATVNGAERSGATARPAPAANATANAKLNAAQVMKILGQNFLTNRKHGRSRAFKQMEEDIMANFSTLVPDSISFDSLVKTVMDIEKFLKDNPDNTADRNPAELVMEFLQGQPSGDADIHIV